MGQFWPYKAWWYQISQNKNFGLLFQKWYLGTQESFCKVSDQLDTQLNNYGLISWHTAIINCVNNCTFIFTRHQPRLFLKALLVFKLCLHFTRWFRIRLIHTNITAFILRNTITFRNSFISHNTRSWSATNSFIRHNTTRSLAHCERALSGQWYMCRRHLSLSRS